MSSSTTKQFLNYSNQTTGYTPVPTSTQTTTNEKTNMENPAMHQKRHTNSPSDEMVRNRSVSSIESGGSAGRLMPSESDGTEDFEPLTVLHRITRIAHSEWFTVGVLCFVNLINYMDRFTIAGVLTDIQEDFKIGDDDAGLLQTAFVLSYMVCAPIFGYLGDRYSRRYIMMIGILLWSTTTLLGSFMNSYGWFITFRALVGIGEASYSTIAPTIISDLFVNDMRSKMLAVFYFAIPVGSGFGYIIGSETAALAENWRWALRVTPILGVIAAALILLIKDPERGESEGSHDLQPTTYTEDIKDLMKNRSFMLSTAGFTCVAFVAGALSWWGPKFIFLGLTMQPGNENLELKDVAFKFGAITMVAGLIGVPFGSYLSGRLIKHFQNVDPLICAVGLIVSAPLMTLAMMFVSKFTIGTYVLIFFGQLALNLNWAIVGDILLYVVVPTRRSTAEAFQILISHALGDAGSPYLVGVFSELIKKYLRNAAHSASDFIKPEGGLESLSLILGDALNQTTTISPVISDVEQSLILDQDTNLVKFEALQYSLFSTSFVEVLGGVFFLITAAYIIRDKQKASQSNLGVHQQVPNRQTSEIEAI